MKMDRGEVKKLRKQMSVLCRNTIAFFIRLRRSGKIIKAIGTTNTEKICKGKVGLYRLEAAICIITRLHQAQSKHQCISISRLNPFLLDRESIVRLGLYIKLGILEEMAMRQYIASLTMQKDCPNDRRQLLVDLMDNLPEPISYDSSKHMSIMMSYREFIAVRNEILKIQDTYKRLYYLAKFEVGCTLGFRPELKAKLILGYFNHDENWLPVECEGGGCMVIIPIKNLVKIKEPYACDQHFGKCLPHFAVESLRALLLYRKNVKGEVFGPTTLCFPFLNGVTYKMGKTGSKSVKFYEKMQDKFTPVLKDHKGMKGAYLREYDERHTASHIPQCLNYRVIVPWLKYNAPNITNTENVLKMVAKEQLGQMQSSHDVNETFYTDKNVWGRVLFYVINLAWSFMDDVEHLERWTDINRWGLVSPEVTTESKTPPAKKSDVTDVPTKDIGKTKKMENLQQEIEFLEKQYQKGNMTSLNFKLEKAQMEEEMREIQEPTKQ